MQSGQAGPAPASHGRPQLCAQKHLLLLQLHSPNGVAAWHLLSAPLPRAPANPGPAPEDTYLRVVSWPVSGCPSFPMINFEVDDSVGGWGGGRREQHDAESSTQDPHWPDAPMPQFSPQD